MTNRFFIIKDAVKGKQFFSDDEQIVHQMSRVLRVRVGELIVCFDGSGKEYVVEVTECHKKCVRGIVTEIRSPHVELDQDVFVYQALPKNPAKFEMVLQKCTELGVRGFYPLVTRRTEVQSLRNIPRLQAIIREAAEQCGAVAIPSLFDVVRLTDVVEHFPDGRVLVAYESEQERLFRDLIPDLRLEKKVSVFIGPEGGFDPQEVADVLSAGAVSVSLGRRILRTETAAISLVSALVL